MTGDAIRLQTRAPQSVEFSFFGAGDDCVVEKTHASAFDDSLLFNILFQQHVLWLDTYLFVSSRLARHISRQDGGQSLFERAAQAGVIVPVYRAPDIDRCYEAYSRLRAIYGPNFAFDDCVNHDVLPRICTAIDSRPEEVGAFVWPKTPPPSGASFHDHVQTYLQTEHPPLRCRYGSHPS